jgi:hypothetical protein
LPFELRLQRAQVVHPQHKIVLAQVERVVAHRVEHLDKRFGFQFVLTPRRLGQVAIFEFEQRVLLSELLEQGGAAGDAADHRLAAAAGRDVAVDLRAEDNTQGQGARLWRSRAIKAQRHKRDKRD